jgi:hypothetical protein
VTTRERAREAWLVAGGAGIGAFLLVATIATLGCQLIAGLWRREQQEEVAQQPPARHDEPCPYCGQHCFVERQISIHGVVAWTGPMATCELGMRQDRLLLGADCTDNQGGDMSWAIKKGR